MKNLPKEKRDQLILVIMLTGMVLSGLWFGLISYQQKSLAKLAERKADAQHNCELADMAIKNAGLIEADLAEAASKLKEFENGMASGDLYSWVINTIRQFKAPYKVEIPQYSQIDGPKDMPMLAAFPYKQATLTVGGTAFFHDFGRFIADLENQFPYLRLLNLTLEPTPSATGNEREKLSFRMDIAVLVKPNAP